VDRKGGSKARCGKVILFWIPAPAKIPPSSDFGATSWLTRLRFVSARQEQSANIYPRLLNWKNHDAFERAYAPPAFHFGATSRLEKDLRTSIS
jgi:hypothetical protein